MSKTYNTPAEIAEDFIKKGWGKDTTFTEVTLEEAERFCYMKNGIKSGRKYFKMTVCGNIYDDNGKLVYLNVSCVSQS